MDFAVPLYSSVVLKPKGLKNPKTTIYLSSFSGYLIRVSID
jgi:hypothetical protein